MKEEKQTTDYRTHNHRTQRPVSVTLIGVLFFLAGLVGVVYHATEFNLHDPVRAELFWILAVRLLAIVGAFFLFRAHNWARWLLVLWMAFHVVVSAFHSASKLIVHGLLLALVAYVLFRRPASRYFAEPQRAKSEVP